jgi:adenylate cyclase
MDLTRWLRFPLFYKYAAVLVFLVSGALLTSSLFDLYFTHQESRTARLELLQQEARSAAVRIEQYVQDIPAQVAWAIQPVWASGSRAADGPAALDERYLGYLGLLRLVPAVVELRYLDASGLEVMRVSRLAMNVPSAGPSYAETPALLEPRPGQPYFGPLYPRDGYEPYMTIAVREQEAGRGVTAAEVNLTYIRDLVDRKIGSGGYAVVVDRAGKLVAHRDVNLMYQGLDLRSCQQVSAALGLERPAAGALPRDACRPRVLSAHAAVDPLGWLVIVEQPEAEALAPFYASLLRSIVLLLVGLGLAFLASLVLARLMVTPIRLLQEGAARMDDDALDQRIEVRTGDELEALADEFNRMAARLDESYRGLEQMVDQRTRELNEQKNELGQALERQTAVSEILRLIARAPADRRAVLETVAENAAVLCAASGASIWLRSGNNLRREAGHGTFAAEVGIEREISRDWITGRAAAEARTVHEPNLAALDEAEYAQSERRFQYGHLSALSTPIRREGEVVGVISIGRRQAEAFSPRQIELLETFADQIIIALELTRLFDEIREKAGQLAITGEQLEALIGRLRRFLSPQVYDLLVHAKVDPREAGLEAHRAEITVVFCDLRGYTAFADRAQPERIIRALKQYHETLGPLIFEHGGTLERFTGDGVMVFFNAPEPRPDPEEQAVRMALKMRDEMRNLSEKWRRLRYHKLGFGIGIDQDIATVGPIGFEGRYDYAVIGSVTNCAARLCSQARDGEVLITQAVYAAVQDLVEVEDQGELKLKGIYEKVRVYNVLGLKPTAERTLSATAAGLTFNGSP